MARLGKSFGRHPQWLLIKHKDEWAGDLDIVEFAPKSIQSDHDFKEILADGFPESWKDAPPAKGGEAGKMYRSLLSAVPQKKRSRSKEWHSNK